MPRGAPTGAVRIEGFSQLRRDLKAMDKAFPRQLGKHLKAAGEKVVLPAARQLAPRRTGSLAASLRVGSAGNKAFIRSKLPYANVQHWGGRVGRNKATFVPGKHYASEAINRNSDRLVQELGEAFEDFARQHGWD